VTRTETGVQPLDQARPRHYATQRPGGGIKSLVVRRGMVMDAALGLAARRSWMSIDPGNYSRES
jgi:hypothetical protein